MVVEFTETFQRANTTSIDGVGGWATISGGVGVGISHTVAGNRAGDSEVATQETTVPLTKDQWIRAVVGAVSEPGSGENAYVAIGAMAVRGTNAYGFGVRLTYAAGGTRTIDFIKGTGANADDFISVGESATVTLASVNSTDLGVPQELYFAVTTVRGGVRLRAAVNNEDLDEPDIEFVLGQDLPNSYPTSPSDYGDWYLAFGTMATANMLSCYEFNAIDELEVIPREQGIGIQNQLTLSEIRTRVIQRYTGNKSSGTNLDTTQVNEEINSAVAEVWQNGVDIFTFMEPEADVSITTDANGFWTAPYYMENVLGVWNTGRRSPASFHEWSRAEDDRPILRFRADTEPRTFSANVRYRARLTRMDADADPCVIPRQYSDIVELGAMRNLARDDSVANRFQFYETRFYRRLDDMKRMENHKRQQRKRVVKALRQPGKVPGQLTPWGTTGI